MRAGWTGITGCALLAILAATAPPSHAKSRIQAPSAAMTSPENLAAVVKAVAPDEERGGYRFRRVEALHGDVETEFVVRMEPGTRAAVEKGRRYVLGFTALLPVPGRRNTYARDPLGARIITLDDAGPALVENTRQVRQLIRTARSEDPEDVERALTMILAQLARDEPSARRFAAAELHLRDGPSELLSDDDGGTLDVAWRGASADAQTRYHLLSVAEVGVGEVGADRLARYAREVLDGHGPRLELTSYDPLLVLTAARALGPVGSTEDLPRLEKHLYSNNTGVPKAVLPSMDSIDPAATVVAARRALATEGLNPETRRVLERFLARTGEPDA